MTVGSNSKSTQKKVTAKVKKVMLIIGKFSSVYNGISLAKL